MKECYECKELKPLDCFANHKNRKDGKDYLCKTCRSRYRKEHRNIEYYKLYKEKNKEKEKIYKERYTTKNREKLLESYRVRRLKDRGLTPEEYEILLKSQNYGCAISGYVPKEGEKRLHVDHDHKTGKVRGLLSNNINNGLGRFEDNPELLRRAADYLDYHTKDIPYGWEAEEHF